jgi:hypothetical protein
VKAIYGLYIHGREAQSAVDRLKAAGVSEADITVLSPEPREDLAFSHMHPRTHMWSIACLGGLIGLLSATGLLLYGEMSWPINVGGLPVVAWWPNLIIMFELTMLGAITATVVTLLVSGELALSRRGIYDTEVTSGNILVGVENPPDGSVDAYERALTVVPGSRIKKL